MVRYLVLSHLHEDDVLEELSHLKTGKSDGDGVLAEHLIFATSALISPLAVYFTSLVRCGFMPSCFRECILIPVPKKNKDITSSSGYCPIALASSISKILEHLMLTKFSSYIHTSPLQFGFKPGSSTSLCTGVVKNIISQCIHNSSSVHGCLLDASVTRLTLLIMVFFFKSSLIVVCPLLLFGSCLFGIVLKQCVFVGINHCLILSVCRMV